MGCGSKCAAAMCFRLSSLLPRGLLAGSKPRSFPPAVHAVNRWVRIAKHTATRDSTIAIEKGSLLTCGPAPQPGDLIRVSPVTFTRIQRAAKKNQRTMSEEMQLQIEQAHAVQNFLGTAQEAYERIKLLNRQTIRTEMRRYGFKKKGPRMWQEPLDWDEE